MQNYQRAILDIFQDLLLNFIITILNTIIILDSAAKMVAMNCTVCRAPIYSCPYNHGYVNQSNLPGLIVCSPCTTNGVFLNYIKSQYSLVDRSLFNQEKYNREVAEGEIQKFKQQETFNDVVIFGILVN